MTRNSTFCEWDVLIVDGTLRRTGESTLLLDALAAHGLRIRLDVVSPPTPARVADSVAEHARRSAYCVMLFTTADAGGRERTSYVAVPDANSADLDAVLTIAESMIPCGSVEVGEFGSDVEGLAERIALRVRGRYLE